MHIIALLFIGFSLGTGVLLMIGNLLQLQEPHRCISKAAGFLLIIGLAGIQCQHLGILLNQFDGFHSLAYTGV
ncbi:MAG: hypothetical protein Q7U57_01510 [Methylovulum sp.]|nr:hypothetical protein [Methylovulum sp.]